MILKFVSKGRSILALSSSRTTSNLIGYAFSNKHHHHQHHQNHQNHENSQKQDYLPYRPLIKGDLTTLFLTTKSSYKMIDRNAKLIFYTPAFLCLLNCAVFNLSLLNAFFTGIAFICGKQFKSLSMNYMYSHVITKIDVNQTLDEFKLSLYNTQQNYQLYKELQKAKPKKLKADILVEATAKLKETGYLQGNQTIQDYIIKGSKANCTPEQIDHFAFMLDQKLIKDAPFTLISLKRSQIKQFSLKTEKQLKQILKKSIFLKNDKQVPIVHETIQKEKDKVYFFITLNPIGSIAERIFYAYLEHNQSTKYEDYLIALAKNFNIKLKI